MDSIYDAKNHFEYLKYKLDPRKTARGIKTKFSEYLRVQNAFLSQVLAEKYPLSLEQADLANQFFDHSKEESEFFILLVSRDRSGTKTLKSHFENQIQIILKKRQLVIERLGRKSELDDTAKGVYYSSWLYAAIHVACTISELQTRSSLALYFGISLEVTGKVLDFLVEQNLLIKEFEYYKVTKTWVRLDKDSPHIIKLHSNWRQVAIRDLEIQTNEDLHYSGVFSMDKKTALRIKDQFMDFIKAQLKQIEIAEEKELYVFNGDFFSLKK